MYLPFAEFGQTCHRIEFLRYSGGLVVLSPRMCVSCSRCSGLGSAKRPQACKAWDTFSVPSDFRQRGPFSLLRQSHIRMADTKCPKAWKAKSLREFCSRAEKPKRNECRGLLPATTMSEKMYHPFCHNGGTTPRSDGESVNPQSLRVAVNLPSHGDDPSRLNTTTS
jgi:hypothetical protein